MTELDLSGEEELTRSFEPCLKEIIRQQTVGREFIAASADLSALNGSYYSPLNLLKPIIGPLLYITLKDVDPYPVSKACELLLRVKGSRSEEGQPAFA